MTLNAVRVALENHLNTTTPPLPAIAWGNVPFIPTTGTSYLRAEFIPAARRPIVMGPDPKQRASGLFFVTVFTPEDQGAETGMVLADTLLARFNGSDAVVAPTVTVRLEYSTVKMPLRATPFYAIPVEIGWYAFL